MDAPASGVVGVYDGRKVAIFGQLFREVVDFISGSDVQSLCLGFFVGIPPLEVVFHVEVGEQG